MNTRPCTSERRTLTRQLPHHVEAFNRALRDRVGELQQIFFDMCHCFRGREAETAADAARECSAQTAHVYTARLLLNRIGKDHGIAESEMRELAPGLYQSAEFDWWREGLRDGPTVPDRERAQRFREQLDAAKKRLLSLLNLYDLSGLDLDLWRDIYQHFLPPEERQRLGGFYTPQELVDLTLDLANYRPEVEKLCEKSVIDPASGSGAFVISALERLLEHLNDKSQPCHRRLHATDVQDGERAYEMLQIVLKNIHAIDVHPFATFLTFINFLIAVLSLYARVRRHRPGFRLDVAIFLGDALLTPGENASQHESGNSRRSPSAVILSSPAVILSEAKDLRSSLSRKSPQAGHSGESRNPQAGTRLGGGDIKQKFDLVAGNPPWGGILKGRLAPFFDDHYKKRLAAEYRDTYAGKLDIYGLFYDRALQWLKPGGTVALVTQGSFIDKDWAAPHNSYEGGRPIHVSGLRRKLAEQASLRYLIDLNPFGKLFFGAMNIPCIGVLEKSPAHEGDQAIVLLSSKKSWPKGMGLSERRCEVVSNVRRCIESVESSGKPLQRDSVSAFHFPLSRLREFEGSRWLLAPKEFEIRTRPEWPRVAQLLEPNQGVTVGGRGCLSIFLMPETRARELGLEEGLLHPIMKGHHTKAWRLEHSDNVILYPYARGGDGRWQPAFACKGPPVLDALDFEHPAEQFEQKWLRKNGINPISIKRLFEHRRDTLNLFEYPQAGEYLLKYYEQLSRRTFKKRNVRDFGRAWYEFIWPRDAEVIFGGPKIISPRLTPRLRFALDQEGTGIQDSCMCLAVSGKTRQAFENFRRRLSGLLGREVKTPTVLRYLLAFLNSSYAQELLTTGHRPRPGDVFQVSDELLEELSVPVSKTRRDLQHLLDAVDACMIARTPDLLQTAESRLNRLVSALYSNA